MANSNFFDMIHEQATTLENNNNNGGGSNTRTEFVRPMRDELQVTKNTPELIVRLLPNSEWLEGNLGNVGYQFAELWAGVTTANGNNLTRKLLLTAPARYTETDQRIMGYLRDGRLHKTKNSKFDPRVQRGAYVYAVQLVQTPTGMVEARDAQGNLDVRLLRLNASAYTAVVKSVGETLYSPQGNAPYSFMSLDIAFPVKISRSGQGLDTKYSVDVFSNIPLGALSPEDVKTGYDPNILELTTAYEESTPEMQAYLKDALDLAEKAPITMGDAVEATEPQANPFETPAFAQPTPTPVPASQAQPAPTVASQPFSQPTPTPVTNPTPTPVVASDNPFGASMQSMPQAPSPVPAEATSPFGTPTTAPETPQVQPAVQNTAQQETPSPLTGLEGLPPELQASVLKATNSVQ